MGVPRANQVAQRSRLPALWGGEEAVERVLNAPPTPEQQARKAASKARQAARKAHQQPPDKQDKQSQQ